MITEDSYYKQFIKNNGGWRAMCFYSMPLVKILGSMDASILISRLFFWDGKGNDPDGHIYKTIKNMEEETGLSRKRQTTAINICKKAGILKVMNKIPECGGSKPIRHFLLIKDKIDKLESK